MSAPAIGADEQPAAIACPTAPAVLNDNGAVCSGGGTDDFSTWQTNRAAAVAGAGGTGVVNTIEYSTTVPSSGSPATGAGNITGTIPAGCAAVTQAVTAYLRCDNGTPNNLADDIWTAIGTYTLTVYPAVGTPTLNTNGCSFTVTGACAGDIVTLLSPTTLGIITGNGTNSATFTANPGEPVGCVTYSVAGGIPNSTCVAFSGAGPTPACPQLVLCLQPHQRLLLVNSTCTVVGGTPSGGSISAPTAPCPTGSTLQYSTNAGAIWSNTVPPHAQSVLHKQF
ncbi:MAG: hypothetical protein IPO92_08215 [Saprospiraceae bacterium]|nr:hypothetical protein [Saprospiraceae bacterium]